MMHFIRKVDVALSFIPKYQLLSSDGTILAIWEEHPRKHTGFYKDPLPGLPRTHENLTFSAATPAEFMQACKEHYALTEMSPLHDLGDWRS